MSFPIYPKYKPSGIDWLGDVPEHWDNWKLSHAYQYIGSGTTPSTENSEYYENGAINWVNTGDLRDCIVSKNVKKITLKAIEDHKSLRVYEKNSIIFAMYGATIGKVGIAIEPFTSNQACCVFPTSKVVDQKYLFFWLIGQRQNIISLATGGGQPNVSQDILKQIRLACPSLSEQTAIAAFLDRETAKIDELITEQRKLIELLKEKRQAVISHVVTKGLNPNVKMKPSGIDWLGDVPKHWEVKPIKHNAKLLTEKTVDKTNAIGLENIESWSGNLIETETVFEGDGVRYEINDLLFGKLRPYLAKIYLAKFNGQAVGDFHVIRFDRRYINPNFAQFYFFNPSFISIVDGSTFGSKMPRASWEFIGNTLICIPPKPEQTAIAAFLDRETAKIDELVNEAESAITLFQERRTALISAAVTGKIDVRKFAS